MRKIKEVLRLWFELGLGQRAIARSCGMGLGTVHNYLERAAVAGMGWPLPEGLSEEELEGTLLGNQPMPARALEARPQPDWKAIHEQRPRIRIRSTRPKAVRRGHSASLRTHEYHCDTLPCCYPRKTCH